jgi:hypothetical protein
MRQHRLAAFVIALAAMAACNGVRSLEEAEKTPEAGVARVVIDAVSHGTIAAIQPQLAPELSDSQSAEQVQRLSTFFPKEAATRMRLLGFHMNNNVGQETKTTSITYELNYPSANFIATVTLRQVGGGPIRARGFNLQSLAAPFDVMNAVTFAGKGPVHYLFPVLMAAAALVTIAASAVWVRRRKTLYRRWWWLLGIFLGAFKITLNWTTGEVNVQALTVQLFSLGYAQDGPLLLFLSLPVGAIAFLILQRRAAGPVAPPLPPAV